jgi:hypothetical protein
MLVRRSKIRRSALSRWTLLAGLALSSALAGGALHAGTPSSDTVQVGGETKKAIGVVTALEAGDVACYIALDDDQGISFRELADFAICEKTSLVGKRVKLAYRMENVMADECQGNPDCTQSKRVALVTSVKVLAKKPTRPAPKPPHP